MRFRFPKRGQPELLFELLAGPGAVLLLRGGLVLVTLDSSERTRAAAQATSASWARLVRTQDLRRLMSQAADDYTSFFATGEERFARRSREHIDELRTRLRILGGEAIGEESRRLQARAVERTEAWITEFVEPSFALQALIARGARSRELLRLTIAGDTSAAYRRDVETMLESIEQQEREQLSALGSAEEAAAERLTHVLLFGAAAAIALGLGLAGYFVRRIGARVERLRGAAAAVGGGDLGHHLPADSGDAIGELTSSFNRMSDDLLSAHEQRRNAEAALRVSEQQRVQADRMAAIGTLAAGVVHEINNPLTYVLANLEVLRHAVRRLPGLDARAEPQLAEIEQMIDEACDGGDRVKRIVRDVKTFSRVDPGSIVPVDLRGVLEAALNVASSELRKRARLVVEHDPCPPVRGNHSQLAQVFLNLLVNAAQACPEGGPERNLIRVRTRRWTGARVAVEVTDTGTGVPDELRHKIFDPFFTTKPIGQGTGLGLSICRSLVAGFGGEIELESTVSIGSTFRVILPEGLPQPDVVEATAPVAAAQASGEQAPGAMAAGAIAPLSRL